jgi:periplasmic copper chaperone A
LALSLSACDKAPVSASLDAPKLAVSDYYVLAPRGENKATAAYVTITNSGKVDDRLIAVACDCAKESQLHTMSMDGNVMKMAQAKDGFLIKAGETLKLARGGHHVMLMGLTKPLVADKTQGFDLKFEKAGKITVLMPVVSQAPLPHP